MEGSSEDSLTKDSSTESTKTSPKPNRRFSRLPGGWRKQVHRFAEPKMSSPHALHHNHNLELYIIDKYKS